MKKVAEIGDVNLSAKSEKRVSKLFTRIKVTPSLFIVLFVCVNCVSRLLLSSLCARITNGLLRPAMAI